MRMKMFVRVFMVMAMVMIIFVFVMMVVFMVVFMFLLMIMFMSMLVFIAVLMIVGVVLVLVLRIWRTFPVRMRGMDLQILCSRRRFGLVIGCKRLVFSEILAILVWLKI